MMDAGVAGFGIELRSVALVVIALVMIALLVIAVVSGISRRHDRRKAKRWRRARHAIAAAPRSRVRHARKPDWVVREVLRLAAWSPGLGCRVLAEVFNRRFAIE